MYLPIPEGLEIPETGTFDLVTTFENREGQLYPIAVDGIPFPEMEEQPEAEAETEAEMQPEAEVETTARRRSRHRRATQPIRPRRRGEGHRITGGSSFLGLC